MSACLLRSDRSVHPTIRPWASVLGPVDLQWQTTYLSLSRIFLDRVSAHFREYLGIGVYVQTDFENTQCLEGGNRRRYQGYDFKIIWNRFVYIVVLFLLTTSFEANIGYSKKTWDVLKQHKQINTTIETQFLFRQARRFDLLWGCLFSFSFHVMFFCFAQFGLALI